MTKDELINKEFRRLNNQIIDLQEDNKCLRIQLIVAIILLVGLICAMNYALTGSI